MKYKKIITKIASLLLLTTIIVQTTGCEWFKSKTNDIQGNITGNEYIATFYTNDGTEFMRMHGEKINLKSNTVEQVDYSSSSGRKTVMSSVVTITIDGHEVENCGSTVIFAADGLTPDVDFNTEKIKNIESHSENGIWDNTIIANTVNKFKNNFGKSRIVVIQSQLGNPICAYSGDSVYYEVCDDLPTTTKLMIDGNALYIHRAEFQIIDKDLLD